MLLLGFAFLTLFTILANIIIGSGHPYHALIVATIGILVTIVVCLLAIPVYGLTGAAAATVAGGFVATAMSAWLVHRRFGVLVSIKTILVNVSISVLFYLTALFSNPSIVHLPILYLVSIIVWLSILFVSKEISTAELTKIYRLIPLQLPYFKR
jgi:O-antigen/teichoic acid export membrane protein